MLDGTNVARQQGYRDFSGYLLFESGHLAYTTLCSAITATPGRFCEALPGQRVRDPSCEQVTEYSRRGEVR
jgi:hypothetical protein